MFKVGDKVVCIQSVIFDNGLKVIKKGNIYTIKHIINEYFIKNNIVLNDIGGFSFTPSVFKLLVDFRKQKINKLLNEKR